MHCRSLPVSAPRLTTVVRARNPPPNPRADFGGDFDRDAGIDFEIPAGK
jgi:hypothetical protein